MSETGSGSMTATSQRAGIMSGKRGLVMGVANERSIAWGIASALAPHGAEVAFSYQAESFRKRLEPFPVSSHDHQPCSVDRQLLCDRSADAR